MSIKPAISQPSILQQAAFFLQGLNGLMVPTAAVAIAKCAVIDYIGVAVAGSGQPVSQNVLVWAKQRSWASTASVIGSEVKLDIEHAALVNAVAGHALDFDDTSWATIGHPTTVILPALLALAEQQPCSGAQLLSAYIAGVEVAHKIADLMMPSASQRGWHTTGIFYSLGTAAAACQLLGLNQQLTTNALALALSRGSGLRSNFGTQTKAYHAGMAAKAGLESVSLAQSGVTSSALALEAEDGFIQCFASAELAEQARSRLEPVPFGVDWDLSSRGYAFKKYPNCSGNHPACDAMLELVNNSGIDWQKIESIHCGVSLLGPKELMCHSPQTPLEARFSMEFSIACALVYGQISLHEFTLEKIIDERIQSLMARITMGVDDELAKLGFIGTAPVKIVITMADGEVVKVQRDFARGNLAQPFSDQEVANKFIQCVQGRMDRGVYEPLLDQLMQLQQVDSMSDIMQTLRVV